MGEAETRQVVVSRALFSKAPLVAEAIAAMAGPHFVVDEDATLAIDASKFPDQRVQSGSLSFATASAAQGADRVVPTTPGDLSSRLSTWMCKIPSGILIPEILQPAFDAIGLQHEIGLGRLVQTFLDVQAARVSALGIDVTRMPMLPPIDLVRDPARPESWVGRFLSPTQALLIDAMRKVALVPTIALERFPTAYASVAREHALDQCALFRGLGFAAELVDAEPLLSSGGLACVATGPGVWRAD